MTLWKSYQMKSNIPIRRLVRAALFLYKERDAIDPTENRPIISPQRKSQSRAEAALLSAPGEDS